MCLTWIYIFYRFYFKKLRIVKVIWLDKLRLDDRLTSNELKKKNLRGLDDNSSNQNYCFLKLYFSANGTQLFSCKTIERVNHRVWITGVSIDMINQKRRWKLSQIFIIFINRRRRKLKEQDLLQLPIARLNWIHQLREESLLIVCSNLVSPWHRRLWLLLGNIFLAGLVDLKWQKLFHICTVFSFLNN